MGQVQRGARIEHAADERVRLGIVQPLQIRGHEKGRHLIVGHLTPEVGDEEGLEPLGGKGPSVPLLFDDPGRNHRATPIS